MNVKRMRELADFIEQHPQKFDMANWAKAPLCGPDLPKTSLFVVPESTPPCGTVACIAGWAAMCFGMEQSGLPLRDVAEEVLGLRHKEANYLFLGDWSRKGRERGLDKVTVEEAVAELRRFADTGEMLLNQ